MRDVIFPKLALRGCAFGSQGAAAAGVKRDGADTAVPYGRISGIAFCRFRLFCAVKYAVFRAEAAVVIVGCLCVDAQFDLVGLCDLGYPHAAEISRGVDTAETVGTRGVPEEVVMGVLSVEYRVMIILGAVNPEQIALFQNAGSKSSFLCREVDAVYAQTRPCGRDIAHDGQTVDLRA